jgi:hypothetical protein
VYKLTKELGYKHVADFLADQTSSELATWIEYEQLDSERQVNMVTHAIVRAFQKPTQTNKASVVDDDDEIIDTTQPGFTEKFEIINATPAGRG